jgi:hypothetical protein
VELQPNGDFRSFNPPLGLGVPGKLHLRAFGEKAFAAALAAPCEGRASTFRPHAGPETVLLFPGSLRSL